MTAPAQNPAQNIDTSPPITSQYVEDMITGMLAKLEELPPYAMTASLTHYDYQSLLWVMLSIVRSQGQGKSS